MTKNMLKICMVQTDLFWEDKEKNLTGMDRLLNTIDEKPDIVILPEMFNTGFTMNAIEMADGKDSETIKWMQQKAYRLDAFITGSIIYTENNRIYNRLIWMKPSGEWEYYDKRHLFGIGGEKDSFSKGEKRKIIGAHGWRICPLICYDLRFPVWSRNTENYDLVIYLANWPASRRLVWDTLLTARAIENQAYVCGVNRIGTDGTGIEYNGGSVMINPKGEMICTITDNKERAELCTISLPLLHEFRKNFPVLSDRDDFNLII